MGDFEDEEPESLSTRDSFDSSSLTTTASKKIAPTLNISSPTAASLMLMHARKQSSSFIGLSPAQERDQTRQLKREATAQSPSHSTVIKNTLAKATASDIANLKRPPGARSDSDSERVNVRMMSMLHVRDVLQNGVTVDLKSHITTESAVKVMVLRDQTINAPTWQTLADNYLQVWKFKYFIRIDIERTPLGSLGGLIFANKLSKASVKLVHLNLNGAKVGGQAIRAILQALFEAGCAPWLRRLELQDNEISMACDSFAYVGKFVNLRALDVSHNCFTLDTPGQVRMLEEGLSPLSQLQVCI
jgi:hypothetical protein